MEIILNRIAGVPIRDQIGAQIELQILSGELQAGERVPSIRVLARRLKVHANTVSAAYRLLEASGLLDLRRGSGVFVLRPGPAQFHEARDLDEMIRLALGVALERYSGPEVRAAVGRWLSGKAPKRIVVIDPTLEMGELLARELSDALGIPATACSLEGLERHPELLAGVLGVTLPYHLAAVRSLVPDASVEAVTLEFSSADRRTILGLPTEAIVLLISHSMDVLRLGSTMVRTLRGNDILVEARLVRARPEWRRLLSAADFAFADAIAFPEIAHARSRHVHEVRFVSGSCLRRLRDALSVVVPRRRTLHTHI